MKLYLIQQSTRAVLCFLLCELFAVVPLPAAEIELTIDWGGVSIPAPFPVTGGIPFARGEVHNSSAVQLLVDDREVPLQTETLAVWPDGSVKWLLLDFQAIPGQKGATLRYGGNASGQKPTSGIQSHDRDDGVTVDTGVMSFSVRSEGTGFLDGLSYRGKSISTSSEKRLNFFDFIHADSPADYRPMQRYVRDGQPDSSRVVVDDVALEKDGPLHAVVRIDGRYTYELVGSTIGGTDIKGDCPFRIRIHAYAGQSFLRVEHFFYYEGDGDHDFAKSLGLKLELPPGTTTARYLMVARDREGEAPAEPEQRNPRAARQEPRPPVGLSFASVESSDAAKRGRDQTILASAPMSGLYQQDADSFVVWESAGRSTTTTARGHRFEGVLDVSNDEVGIAVGVKDFWKNAAKALHADLSSREIGIYFWPPEACPLDFRRHAREWSVGETGTPNDPRGDKPAPMRLPNYRLASKGVGKTHYALIYLHEPGVADEQIRNVYRLFNHRPLLWASPRHYAASLALGRYCERVEGEHDQIEEILNSGIDVWRASQERFRWYGFWLYGNVCQDYNGLIPNGRWCREFGRWGWANGDSVGRLAYALMLQTVRECRRDSFQFGESYLYNVHDVCSTHTSAYPHHYSTHFKYVKGASHRHGAWPWACVYLGARGSHPVGAKIYYFLTGEGHAKDILEELTQLALKNPNGGEGDGPLGPNAQIFLYQWEATGDDQWRQRLEAEINKSELLRTADTGWLCMMSAAFGIKDALDEYMDLTGDFSRKDLAADFADRSMPEKMKRHWTWGGYFRVYASAYNMTRDEKYKNAIKEMLEVLQGKANGSLAVKIPQPEWPGPPGGPEPFVDANIIRDVPFALYSLHADDQGDR